MQFLPVIFSTNINQKILSITLTRLQFDVDAFYLVAFYLIAKYLRISHTSERYCAVV